VGENGTVLKTTGGTTWTRQTVPTTLSTTTLNGVDFADPQNGIVVGDDGTVLRTENGGTTWTLISLGTDRHLLDVFLWDTDFGWAVGANGTIRRLN
jgi:photosystem II stability/assembly factor-like uncharacterized protein